MSRRDLLEYGPRFRGETVVQPALYELFLPGLPLILLPVEHKIYRSAQQPVSGAQKALGILRKAGWIIVLYTARHFNHWRLTVDWLSRHEFEYDQIVFGKPPARFYIDDRAIAFNGDWEQLCQKIATQVIK